MGKIFCTECGTELNDSVKFCSNCGTPLNDENDSFKSNKSINNGFTIDDLMTKIQILPIVFGCILTIILWILGSVGVFGLYLDVDMLFPKGVAYCILFSSLVAGYLCKESAQIALIHGLLIAIIMEFFFLFTTDIAVGHSEFYFLCIIAGIFGSFIGNFIRTKVKK